MRLPPTAQELINNCHKDTWQWIEWYNSRMKFLNMKRVTIINTPDKKW